MSGDSGRTATSARLWQPLSRLIFIDRNMARWAAQRRATMLVYEFARFGVKQAWACLFGAIMLTLLILTRYFYPAHAALPRYDFLTLAALCVQAFMLWARLETFDEAKVIALFHVTGTAMEVFKTAGGSWTYPEFSYLHIGGVPLFTGFMYASIGSFMARCWRLFDFRFEAHPPMGQVYLLACAIYANFFFDHFGVDLRLWLLLAAVLVFGRTWIDYRVWHHYRRMPLLLANGLTALFIWVAENIGTYTKTWLYPDQSVVWTYVSLGKFTSWYLLLVISYAMVALVNKPKNLARGVTDAVTP